MTRRLRGLAALLLVLVAFTGCDDGRSVERGRSNPVGNSESDGGGCEPGDPMDPALTVTLDEYRILPEEDKLTSGPTRFRAANAGKKTHELYVIAARSIEALPLDRKGSVDTDTLEEEGRLIGELEGIPSGQSCDLEVDLEPGTYVLLCNLRSRGGDGVENHFLQGMRARIKVK